MYSWQLYMLSVRFYLQPRGVWRQTLPGKTGPHQDGPDSKQIWRERHQSVSLVRRLSDHNSGTGLVQKVQKANAVQCPDSQNWRQESDVIKRGVAPDCLTCTWALAPAARRLPLACHQPSDVFKGSRPCRHDVTISTPHLLMHSPFFSNRRT